MRKIIVSMRVTLDGFIAGPHGEMDWMEEYLDEALGNYESELRKQASHPDGHHFVATVRRVFRLGD